MIDNLQEPVQRPQPENPSIANDLISQSPKKSNKNLLIIIGIVIGLLCLVSIVCVVIVGLGAGKIVSEQAPVESVLDTFMTYMVDKDVESAYALFSPRAQRQIPISKIQEMINGINYILFEGYQSLNVQNLNITAATNTDQNIPQGIVAKVSGTITYQGDIQGTFTSTLEKVNNKWQLDGIFITVPPNKFQP